MSHGHKGKLSEFVNDFSQNMSSSQTTPRKEYFTWKNVDYCCLCETTNHADRFTNIFSVPGKRKALPQQIENVLGIKITLGESLRICRNCELKINNFSKFKTSATSVLLGLKEKVSSKRCLTFSPQKEGKRANVHPSGSADENEDESIDQVPPPLLHSEVSVAAAMKVIVPRIEKECTMLCWRHQPSELRKNDFSNMSTFTWDKVTNEMASRCPILLDILLTAMGYSKINMDKIAPRLSLCYAIIMQSRNHELTLVQRLNTILMTNGNAKKQLFVQCQKMGFCLSHTSKIKLLDILGNHFADIAIDQVRLGNKLQGTGDNWDMKIRPHDMLSTHQNTDLHYFASNLIVERVPCDNLSRTSPQKDLLSLPNSAFLLSMAEATKLKEDFKVLVARVLVTNIPQLSFLKSIVPQHIPHKYQQEMANKSTIIPLPMQMKDEKKYEDVVDILDSYEQQLEDIYVRAGVVQKHKGPEQPASVISGESATPDQAAAHFNKDDANDHMKGISVPFGGDQLTRVRFAGAKDLRAGTHTAKQRFDHCSPFVSELFHTKMAYVQFIFNLLYKSGSTREVGTLKFFREKYNRRNVTPEKVANSYEGTEQFILSVGKAYLLNAALDFWGMEKLDDQPTKNVPPPGILHDGKEKKMDYFDKVIGNFVDQYVVADPDKESNCNGQESDDNKENEQADRVRAYGLNVIELTVFLMQLIDTCKEGDGERSVINKKRLLMYFRSSTSFQNYSIEMFTSIAQVKALVSEEMAHRLTWGRFVNWHGGAGKNIACDMAQEICNRTSKDIVRGMGANKTRKAMMRASKASAGVRQIVQQLQDTTKIKKTSQAHTHRNKEDDEILMLQDLQKLKPFELSPGRYHRHFQDMHFSPASTVDMTKLFGWLEKHKKQIARGQFISVGNTQ